MFLFLTLLYANIYIYAYNNVYSYAYNNVYSYAYNNVYCYTYNNVYIYAYVFAKEQLIKLYKKKNFKVFIEKIN